MSEKFHLLDNLENLPLPEKFTFPFYYEPHSLALKAAKELQNHLQNQTEFDHNFGLNPNQNGLVIGKMFGVLVVKNQANELGFLAAFSGKLANENHWNYFVPPVFDMLTKDSYFLEKEDELNALNSTIESLKKESNLPQLLEEKDKIITDFNQKIAEQKEIIKQNKAERDSTRIFLLKNLSNEDYELENKKLINQSLFDKRILRDLKSDFERELNSIEQKIVSSKNEIDDLKNERKSKSNHLQEYLFQQYKFLNSQKESKSLLEIFGKNPPSAAGECAAPKLLQFAFTNDYEPICMAEFWWGESPKSEIRKHQNFYPACTAKCQPILGHMLSGISLEENLIHAQNSVDKKIEIVYEDEDIIVINKPENFLSVPGIEVKDSVQERMRLMYPEISSPMIVHRLDMQTSGILVLAKNKLSHERLQKQFLKKKISKRYVALLNGEIEHNEGEINLPLRVDLDDRPRQLVCYDYGKPSVTRYKVLEKNNGITRIHFYPITGRTHQLRVHSSHVLGLNTPILGDDLYGNKAERLYLHAEKIEFFHPISNKKLTFIVAPKF